MDCSGTSLNINKQKKGLNVNQKVSNVIIHKCKIPILVRSKDRNTKAKAIRAIYVEFKKDKQLNRRTISAENKKRKFKVEK